MWSPHIRRTGEGGAWVWLPPTQEEWGGAVDVVSSHTGGLKVGGGDVHGCGLLTHRRNGGVCGCGLLTHRRNGEGAVDVVSSHTGGFLGHGQGAAGGGRAQGAEGEDGGI